LTGLASEFAAAQIDLDQVQVSVNTATGAMMEAAGLKPVTEIAPIKKASQKAKTKLPRRTCEQ